MDTSRRIKCSETWDTYGAFRPDQTKCWSFNPGQKTRPSADHSIQTRPSVDHPIRARRPDLMLINKKNLSRAFGSSRWHRLKIKESKKIDKCLNLTRGVKKLWNMKVLWGHILPYPKDGLVQSKHTRSEKTTSRFLRDIWQTDCKPRTASTSFIWLPFFC